MLFFDSLTGADTVQRSVGPDLPPQTFSLSDLITHMTYRFVRALERILGL